jgi:membrane-associated phospholipid phosphatase
VILYTLVPVGRWRNLGKWAAAGLLGLVALGRMALGVEAPVDILVGVLIGVTIPLVAFRLFTRPRSFRSVTDAGGRIWMWAGHGERRSGQR